MTPFLLVTLLGLGQTPPTQVASPVPAPAVVSLPAVPSVPLSYASVTLPFDWDRIIPMNLNVDGLKVEQIFFNKRVVDSGFFRFMKGAEFGTRAQLKVTNTSSFPKVPGFAVAVLDKDGNLLGVASGGTKIGTISPGTTETFDLNFTQVHERLSKGDHFLLAIELRN
jgi:hypothetical protein